MFVSPGDTEVAVLLIMQCSICLEAKCKLGHRGHKHGLDEVNIAYSVTDSICLAHCLYPIGNHMCNVTNIRCKPNVIWSFLVKDLGIVDL